MIDNVEQSEMQPSPSCYPPTVADDLYDIAAEASGHDDEIDDADDEANDEPLSELLEASSALYLNKPTPKSAVCFCFMTIPRRYVVDFGL